MRWFTSDLHLGHKNIIKFCNRPYRDVDHMDTAIINTINATVMPDDELWVLGDIAMGHIDTTLRKFEQINARVTIVAGNHDRCHPSYHGQDKAREWLPRYEGLRNVEQVYVHGALTLVAGQVVTVCHFPYRDEDRHSDRFTQYLPVDEGNWLLHGHVHDTWQVNGRQINVGIDAWDGQLVSEGAITKIMGASDE